jgi:hypothetical protein
MKLRAIGMPCAALSRCPAWIRPDGVSASARSSRTAAPPAAGLADGAPGAAFRPTILHPSRRCLSRIRIAGQCVVPRGVIGASRGVGCHRAVLDRVGTVSVHNPETPHAAALTNASASRVDVIRKTSDRTALFPRLSASCWNSARRTGDPIATGQAGLQRSDDPRLSGKVP